MPRKSTKVPKTKTYHFQASDYLGKLENNLASNQSRLSLILGLLIVIVVGILTFNFFNGSKPDLGPAQQTQQTESAAPDVTADNLPGKYTVREGDTLFTIAQQYYKDGSKFTKLAETNNLANPDEVEAGQVLDIPKLENQTDSSTQVSPSDTEWGPKIEGNTYTVQNGDWLSKIAGRTYGDIFAFEKLAKANNIPNPDLIEPGQVLTIPR